MPKPKPFQRQSIDLDAPKRSWVWVYPDQLNKGDIVADMGVVRWVRYGYNTVEVGAGESLAPHVIPKVEKVYAFVVATPIHD